MLKVKFGKFYQITTGRNFHCKKNAVLFLNNINRKKLVKSLVAQQYTVDVAKHIVNKMVDEVTMWLNGESVLCPINSYNGYFVIYCA